MHITNRKSLSANESEQLNVLWNTLYPVKLNNRFNILLEGVEDFQHYLISDEAENVLAWAVIFNKDNEMRFSLLVEENHQGKGLGSQLIQKLKSDYPEFYGWVIDHDKDLKLDGTNYKSPLKFYQSHGFEVLSEQRIDTEMLKAVKVKWVRKLFEQSGE